MKRDANVKCIKVEHIKCNNFETFEPFTLRMTPNNKFKLIESTIPPEVVARCRKVVQALEDIGGTADSQKELVGVCAELSGDSPSTCKRHIAKAVEEGFVIREKNTNNKRTAYVYRINE